MVDSATQSLVTTALIIIAILLGLLLLTRQGLKLYRTKRQSDIEAQPRKRNDGKPLSKQNYKRTSHGQQKRRPGVSVFYDDSGSAHTSRPPSPPPKTEVPSRPQPAYVPQGGRPDVLTRDGRVQGYTTLPSTSYDPRVNRIRFSSLNNLGRTETVQLSATPRDLGIRDLDPQSSMPAQQGFRQQVSSQVPQMASISPSLAMGQTATQSYAPPHQSRQVSPQVASPLTRARVHPFRGATLMSRTQSDQSRQASQYGEAHTAPPSPSEAGHASKDGGGFI